MTSRLFTIDPFERAGGPYPRTGFDAARRQRGPRGSRPPADRFREWLDHERHTYLQHALANREADFLDCLEALRTTGFEDETLNEADAAGRRMMESLAKG